MYEEIPVEMRAFRQWVLWRLEDRGGGKPTKVPYCVLTNRPASVSTPSDWTTFDEVVSVCQSSNHFSGIGFVLTKDDPYCFIDLDSCKECDYSLQSEIYNSFETYAERSPSGSGLHLICKASVPSGKRKRSVELYSSARYMTMTGDVFEKRKNIEYYQSLASLLWERMGGVAVPGIGPASVTIDDRSLLVVASEAKNGSKFKDLFDGHWQQFYRSQSEADLALMNMIAFYTQDRDQVKRIFMSSALGAREKAQRHDYINGMIERSFDQLLPTVDVELLANQTRMIIASEPGSNGMVPKRPPIYVAPREYKRTPRSSLYTYPSGMVGEIAQFVFDSSVRPVPESALAASIGLMSGICGKGYNVSGTGLNQYILLLAKTGIGKEGISTGIEKLVECVKFQIPTIYDFVGPGDFASGQGLVKYLSDSSSCFVSVLGEIGLRLQQMSSPFAPANEKVLKRILLDLYNKSGRGQALRPTVYSDKVKNTSIVNSPAFSLVGEGTPESFYRGIDETMISDGLLPRFLILEYTGLRPKMNRNHVDVMPTLALQESLAGLVVSCQSLMAGGNIIDVKFDTEGDTYLKSLDDECDDLINSSDDEVKRQLWNRCHLKTLKLAAIVAVGINPYDPIITLEVTKWAEAIVKMDIENIMARFDSGRVGIQDASEADQIDLLKRAIFDYLTKSFDKLEGYGAKKELYDAKVISYSFLHSKITMHACFRKDRIGRTNALKRTVQTILECGDIVEIDKFVLGRYGYSGRGFMLKNQEMLGEVRDTMFGETS